MPSTLIQPSRKGINLERLNPNQRLFVEALLADRQFNPTNAAKAAGYKNAPQAANKLLKNKLVAAAIGKAIEERRYAFKLDAQRVLQELSCIGFFDIRKLFDEKGRLLEVAQYGEDAARAVQSIKVSYSTSGQGDEVETIKTVEIKLWNKIAALELLAKHLGMMAPQKVEVEHSVAPSWNALMGKPELVDPVQAKLIENKIIKDQRESESEPLEVMPTEFPNAGYSLEEFDGADTT